MSSALDEDTQRTLAAGRDAAGDMLRSAQKDLQKVFIVWLVGFVGTFYGLRLFIWPFLKRVTEAQMEAELAQDVKIIAQTPFDVILLQAKIAMVVGLLVALPPFIYFARDALKRRGLWPQAPVPLWKIVPLVVFGVALFAGGVLYGYLVFFPFTFEFLARNAVLAGFKPTYSIVMWAQFIFLLTMSFGLAAELPLVMASLAYAEIVPYETFRDYWRHAVVLIFIFGAVFSPPDPFTQILWAVPLLCLYALSLFFTKVVVTTRRGSERLDVRGLARDHWNLLLGGGFLVGAAVYFFYTRGGVAAVNRAVGPYTKYRLLPAGATTPLSPEVATVLFAVVGGLLGVLAVLVALFARELGEVPTEGDLGEPAAIDLESLDAAGVRAAPPEAFAALGEEEALARANEAMDAGDPEKAQAILDRFDEAQAAAAEGEGATGGEGAATGGTAGSDAAAGGGGSQASETAPAAGGLADRTSRASEAFFSELNEGEDDEDDIGGYYHDVRFIADSVASKSFRIIGVFMLVLAGVFAWLYTGGIGRVKDDFLRRLPAAVVANTDAVGVVALHPVEALIFEVKFSTLIAVLAVLPMLAYYAWPALRERGFVYGRRYVIFGWTATLVAGLFGGFAFGYAVVAPEVISYLVADALRANLIISYRITNFFWLIFFTTAGIGLLADIPVLMLLLNTAGVSFDTMAGRWREVTVGIMTFAAIFTPASISTMVMMTVPLMVAYGVGLGVLFPLTLAGRRDLSYWLGDEDAVDLADEEVAD
ncbi:MAG: twin-arginine translocase subunit TatC [Haloferacaceae archaeon]